MLSVVVPAFNEEKCIADTVNALITASKKEKVKIEVIVVDDCSSDKTASQVDTSKAVLIRNVQNVGYGKSIKIGISRCKFETIAITDADGTYAVEDLFKMIPHLNEGFDLVVGDRTNVRTLDSVAKNFLRLILRHLTEAASGIQLYDPNSGLRVFKKTEIESIMPVLCDRFSFTTSMSVAYGITGKYIKYIPIVYSKRIGSSKVRLIRDSVITIIYIMRTVNYYNPLKIFLFLASIVFFTGLLSVVVGLCLAITTAIQFGVGTMITSIFIVGLGLLSEQVRLLRHETNNKTRK